MFQAGKNSTEGGKNHMIEEERKMETAGKVDGKETAK